MRPPRVTVIVLTYDSERFVDACFGSLRRAALGAVEPTVVAVDNGSRDGTVARIREGYPEVHIVETGANLGFAGGNNVALRRALEGGADYVYLLNPDTEVAPDFLTAALAVAEEMPRAGAVQSLLLLADERDRINTAGNQIQFLGFGHCGQYREPVENAPRDPVQIAFASGAAVLLRAEALREVGVFDEELFLYQEDMDLGWRLRLAGWDNVLAPRSVVYHAYEFSRSPAKFYFVERNRYVVLLKNSSPRTLALLAPSLLAAELGLLAIATRSGWVRQKLRADAYFLRASTWRHIRRERRRVGALRRRTDAEIMALHVPDLSFPELDSPFLTRVANPLMRVAWNLVRRAIR